MVVCWVVKMDVLLVDWKVERMGVSSVAMRVGPRVAP